MHKIGKAAAILSLVLLLAVAGMWIWQRDNLRILLQGAQNTQDELQEQILENEQMVNRAVASAGLAVRDLTDEERLALQSGETDREALLDAILAGDQTETPVQADADVLPAPADAKQEYQEKLAGHIAEAYILRAEFTGKLEDLLAEAKAEYRSVPKAQRNFLQITAMAARYIAKAGELELAADAAMEALLTRLTELCREYGESDAIVTTIRESYDAQKSSTKAYYLAMLAEKTN